MLTHARLLNVLRYDPETGLFYWRVALSRRVKVGDVAGTKDKQRGYIRITIDGQCYWAHRLAFFYMTGRWPRPGYDIDHADDPKDDNRWCNLREATRIENGRNRTRLNRRNTSGVTGVSWCKQRLKWRSYIQVGGRNKNLGYFTNRLAAIAKRKAAERKHYGEFAPNPVPEHMKFHPPLSE